MHVQHAFVCVCVCCVAHTHAHAHLLTRLSLLSSCYTAVLRHSSALTCYATAAACSFGARPLSFCRLDMSVCQCASMRCLIRLCVCLPVGDLYRTQHTTPVQSIRPSCMCALAHAHEHEQVEARRRFRLARGTTKHGTVEHGFNEYSRIPK